MNKESLLFIPDWLFLELMFFRRLHKVLNLRNPKTFNEKIQWLKLNDRNPNYPLLVDKYSAKQVVANTIGEKYVIPNLGVWDSFTDISFDDLPNRFVLKCTHDSGGIVICDNKDHFDYYVAKENIEKAITYNYYSGGREWPYKNIKPRIIAEPYLEDEEYGELRDYKFFCFDGEPKIMFVAANRQSREKETTFDFFDMDYNHLNIINGHPNSDNKLDKPKNFELMIELARILSKDIPHVRIDFYEVNGNVYFGEYTFYHYSGFTPFEPEEWDYILGDMIHLPI